MNFSDETVHRQKSGRKYLLAIVILVLIVAAAGIMFYMGNNKGGKGVTDNAAVSSTPVLKYPDNWEELQINSAYVQADVVLLARKSNPKVNLVASSPESVQGKLDSKFDIKSLPDKLAASYKKNYDNFELIKTEVVKVDKYESVKMQSKYSSKSSSEVMEYINMVIPTPNATYYLNYQAKVGEIDKVQNDIDQINSAFVNHFVK